MYLIFFGLWLGEFVGFNMNFIFGICFVSVVGFDFGDFDFVDF